MIKHVLWKPSEAQLGVIVWESETCGKWVIKMFLICEQYLPQELFCVWIYLLWIWVGGGFKLLSIYCLNCYFLSLWFPFSASGIFFFFWFWFFKETRLMQSCDPDVVVYLSVLMWQLFNLVATSKQIWEQQPSPTSYIPTNSGKSRDSYRREKL